MRQPARRVILDERGPLPSTRSGEACGRDRVAHARWHGRHCRRRLRRPAQAENEALISHRAPFLGALEVHWRCRSGLGLRATQEVHVRRRCGRRRWDERAARLLRIRRTQRTLAAFRLSLPASGEGVFMLLIASSAIAIQLQDDSHILVPSAFASHRRMHRCSLRLLRRGPLRSARSRPHARGRRRRRRRRAARARGRPGRGSMRARGPSPRQRRSARSPRIRGDVQRCTANIGMAATTPYSTWLSSAVATCPAPCLCTGAVSPVAGSHPA